MIPLLLLTAATFFSNDSMNQAFAGRTGALVIIDCGSGDIQRYHPLLCEKKVAPCSTFKIWNTAIGLETGILTDADQAFWKWDGVKRSIDPWNQDLTLRQAYAFSCVPAYQALARKIGAERMNGWLKKLGYGDLNTTSGLDVFWLPAPGRKPLLISPDEQAFLMKRLATGEVPFSKQTQTILKEIMKAKADGHVTIYGKTGTSGTVEKGVPETGWFVGYATTNEATLAFACLLQGENATGKEARSIVENLFAH